MSTYLHIFDVTKDWNDPNCCAFRKMPVTHDIAGLVTEFAQAARTDVSNIRMFVCPSKKEWTERYQAWLDGVDWNKARRAE